MFKNRIRNLLVPILLFTVVAGQSQVQWIDDVSLTIPEDRMVAFISDFASFMEVKNMPVYMTASGQINAPTPNPSGYILDFELFYKSDDLGNIVIKQASKPFILSEIGLADGDYMSFTNLIFNNGMISSKQTLPIEWGSPDVTRPPEFSEDDLGGGTFPPGGYIIHVDFYAVGTTDPTPDFVLNFQVLAIPTFLELIYPGWDYSSDDVPVIYQEFPVFQWRPENGEAFSKFNLLVYQKMDFHRSLMDITQSDPIADYTIDYSDPANTLPRGLYSLPYQETSGKPLQFGGTYVWKVEGTVPSSSGPDILRVESPFYVFSLRKPGDQSGSTFGAMEYLIKKLFDGDIPENVVNDLRGVYFNGTIRINGRMVTATDLNRMINKLEEAAANDDKAISDYIKQVTIEEK